MNEDKIQPVGNPQEQEDARMKMVEIRFECLVKMYDCGFRSYKVPTIIPFMDETKHYPPQWFKKFFRFSLEEIKYGDPKQIGRIIQDAYRELESHIDKYEKS